MSGIGRSDARRYFWGNTLAPGARRAARQFQIGPDELAWRPVEKRHGFVKQPRRFLIEVDPAAPRRTGNRPEAAPAAAVPAPVRPAPPRTAVPATPPEAAAPARRQAPPERPCQTPPRHRRRASGGRTRVRPGRLRGDRPRPSSRPTRRTRSRESPPPWRSSRSSASPAWSSKPSVEALPDRLEVRLQGPGESRLRELGPSILDDLGYLLPRLIKSLSGKHILCRIDGAGLRDAREEELRTLARAAAAQVLETGEPVTLDPLPPGERRIVHLTLADDPRLVTESLGQGVEKRLRVAPATSGPRTRSNPVTQRPVSRETAGARMSLFHVKQIVADAPNFATKPSGC